MGDEVHPSPDGSLSVDRPREEDEHRHVAGGGVPQIRAHASELARRRLDSHRKGKAEEERIQRMKEALKDFDRELRWNKDEISMLRRETACMHSAYLKQLSQNTYLEEQHSLQIEELQQHFQQSLSAANAESASREEMLQEQHCMVKEAMQQEILAAHSKIAALETRLAALSATPMNSVDEHATRPSEQGPWANSMMSREKGEAVSDSASDARSTSIVKLQAQLIELQEQKRSEVEEKTALLVKVRAQIEEKVVHICEVEDRLNKSERSRESMRERELVQSKLLEEMAGALRRCQNDLVAARQEVSTVKTRCQDDIETARRDLSEAQVALQAVVKRNYELEETIRSRGEPPRV